MVLVILQLEYLWAQKNWCAEHLYSDDFGMEFENHA